MIELLGKRPFTGRSDDMDKWLDENHQKVPNPPPGPMPNPPSEAEEPIPDLVTAATRVNERL
jgi:AFG3 family protein